MNTSTQDLTLDNYTERTGRRFRVSTEQAARIREGSLTREQAFQEFLANGGPEARNGREAVTIPDSVFLEEGLTLENFSERVEAATGSPRRFRVSREQSQRIQDGTLTREGALAEVISQKREAVNQ